MQPSMETMHLVHGWAMLQRYSVGQRVVVDWEEPGPELGTVQFVDIETLCIAVTMDGEQWPVLLTPDMVLIRH
jgi:hypothetical protein